MAYEALESTVSGRARCMHCRDIIAKGARVLALGWEPSRRKRLHLECALAADPGRFRIALAALPKQSADDRTWLNRCDLACRDRYDAMQTRLNEAEKLEATVLGGPVPRLERQGGGACSVCSRRIRKGTLHITDRSHDPLFATKASALTKVIVHLECVARYKGATDRWERSLVENSADDDVAVFRDA